MIPDRLKKFLEIENAGYRIVPHQNLPESHPAQSHSRISAKAVLVRAGNSDIMVVLPKGRDLDLAKLKLVLEVEELALESRREYAKLFPDCEDGCVPALGTPYNLPCYLDQSILDWADVLFEGGNHEEDIELSTDEYWRLSAAEIGDFKSAV